jgi:hypothetical protein
MLMPLNNIHYIAFTNNNNVPTTIRIKPSNDFFDNFSFKNIVFKPTKWGCQKKTAPYYIISYCDMLLLPNV